MSPKHASTKVLAPPVAGAPRGAHSIGAHQHEQVGGPPVSSKRHLATAHHRRRIRAGAVLGLAAVGVAAVVVVVALIAAPPPKRPHAPDHSAIAPTSTLAPKKVSTLPTLAAPSGVLPTQPSPTTTVPPQPSISTTTPPAAATIAPSDILVEVLNGVGTRHVATDAARSLRARGFLINGTGNANAFDYSDNVVQYRPGSFAAAETVAHYVSGTTQFVATRSLQRNEVWIILGSAYAGVID